MLTSSHSNEEVEEMYEETEKMLKQTKWNSIIIMGDWNARVEESNNENCKYEMGRRNDRGQRLLQFCEQYNLMIANTAFYQPKKGDIPGPVILTLVDTN